MEKSFNSEIKTCWPSGHILHININYSDNNSLDNFKINLCTPLYMKVEMGKRTIASVPKRLKRRPRHLTFFINPDSVTLE